MARNIDDFITPVEHSAIDHTGIPGVGSGGGSVTGEVVPAGTIMPYGGPVATVPSGYLPCDGSVVAEATYPALYAAIGNNWDIGGEGAGNFRLPDFRGRSPVGLNDGTLPAGANGGFSARTLAATGGEEAHILSAGELAAHGHGVIDPGHSHTTLTNMSDVVTNSPQPANDTTRVSAGNQPDLATALGGINNNTTGITIQNTGSNIAHNTMHPFAVANYIIKAEEGAPTVVGIGSDTLPTGTITSFAGTVASIPVGFLPCDGSLVDQAVEADLFAVIGTAWNIGGEPGGFFRLPDMRGKAVVGLNDGTLPNGADGGFSARTLAATGGAETHTLSQAELAAHSHSLANFQAQVDATSQALDGGGNGSSILTSSTVSFGRNVSFSSVIGSTASAGSSSAHNNMSPFAVCPYIIKSRQVGGGIGLTAQNNGGPLVGPRPTFNFIPTGGAGIMVADNPGQNRVDVTIDSSDTFDATAHEAVDHTGAPFNLLDSAAHAAIDHSAVSGAARVMAALQFGGDWGGGTDQFLRVSGDANAGTLGSGSSGPFTRVYLPFNGEIVAVTWNSANNVTRSAQVLVNGSAAAGFTFSLNAAKLLTPTPVAVTAGNYIEVFGNSTIGSGDPSDVTVFVWVRSYLP